MANQMTEVRLLAVPLEKDYKHTLYFASEEAQAAYFIGRTISHKADFSYQRKEGYIRYPAHFDDLQNCNYLMYRNSPFSSKWYYAFITKMEFKGEETTWIYFETDVMQTYHFDYVFKPSFIDREHASSDKFGEHTIPENLEIGEYVCQKKDSVTDLEAGLKIVIACTETVTPGVDGVQSGSGRYDGLYSGLEYIAYTTEEISKLEETIKNFDEAGKAEAIQHVFMAPTWLAPIVDEIWPTVLKSSSPHSIEKTIGFRPGELNKPNDYYPRNKKLNSYPFRYLLVSNNNGGSAIYQYEHFINPNPPASLTPDPGIGFASFKIYGALTPGCSIRMIPTNYKGVPENHEEGINLGKYPICNWVSDVYTNWLTQNSVNVGISMASGIGQILTGGISEGIGTIAGQLAQMHQMSMVPGQARGNTNSGDVITAMQANTFHFYHMTIKDEYLRIVDEYFDMFGYKTNRVKIPSKNHRASYWYTKTIDASIDGVIPNEDIQKIKACYDAGITFWKNPENIGDYSVSNKIV